METVDFQILDGGAPQRLIDPPIWADIPVLSCIVRMVNAPKMSNAISESHFWPAMLPKESLSCTGPAKATM
jgi:hypothetical protein